jgi:glycosyltransferase involved in cell wall biosynthesis
MLSEITPLILTFNEAPNIERTLRQLTWAKRIVIVDSFSTDETLEISRHFPQVEVIQRAFDSFAAQCNFGLTHITTPWVLSLDADYVLSNELKAEMETLPAGCDASGFSVRFRYCIYGQPLRASLYPPRVVLYRRDRAQYRDEGHGHRVQIEGRVRQLEGMILHDDRKPLERWFAEQSKYASREALHLLTAPSETLRTSDRVRRMIVPAPALVFAYALFGKGLVLDGWRGFFYALQRMLAEIFLSLRLIELRLQGNVRRDCATPDAVRTRT